MKSAFYDWGGANIWLFYLINGVHNTFLDSVMEFGTLLAGYRNFPLYLALIAIAGLILSGRAQSTPRQEVAARWLAVLAVLSLGYVLDGLLLAWLKPLLDFPRPALALPPGSVHIVGEPDYHYSLPSGHASFAMLVAASLWPVCSRSVRIVLVSWVLWVGLSRISLGAHFPADVVAGYAKSIILVWLLRISIARMFSRGREYPPDRPGQHNR